MKALVIAVVSSVLSLLAPVIAGSQLPPAADRSVTVMTRNAYHGVDAETAGRDVRIVTGGPGLVTPSEARPLISGLEVPVGVLDRVARRQRDRLDSLCALGRRHVSSV